MSNIHPHLFGLNFTVRVEVRW